jgi:hypothetical protein
VELQSARPRSPATSEPGNDRFAGSRRDVIAAVERGLDALAPMLAHLLTDRSISGESAMHLVVMDPAADVRKTPFEEAILRECSFGNTASWQADYAAYARVKTRLCWRERMTLRTLFARHAERLQPDDIRVEGAVCDGRWTVGASGAQAWYDHAIASMAIALFDAALEHGRQRRDDAGR